MSNKKHTRDEWAKKLGTSKYYVDKLIQKIERETLVDIYSHDNILDVKSVADKNLECEKLLRKNKMLREDNDKLWDRISSEQQKSIWKQIYEYARGLRGKK